MHHSQAQIPPGAVVTPLVEQRASITYGNMSYVMDKHGHLQSVSHFMGPERTLGGQVFSAGTTAVPKNTPGVIKEIHFAESYEGKVFDVAFDGIVQKMSFLEIYLPGI